MMFYFYDKYHFTFSNYKAILGIEVKLECRLMLWKNLDKIKGNLFEDLQKSIGTRKLCKEYLSKR